MKSVSIEVSSEWTVFKSAYTYQGGGNIGVSRIINNYRHQKSDGTIEENAQLVLIRIVPLEDFQKADDRIESTKNDLLELTLDYQTLLDRHVKIHKEFFNRIRLDLHGGTDH